MTDNEKLFAVGLISGAAGIALARAAGGRRRAAQQAPQEAPAQIPDQVRDLAMGAIGRVAEAAIGRLEARLAPRGPIVADYPADEDV